MKPVSQNQPEKIKIAQKFKIVLPTLLQPHVYSSIDPQSLIFRSFSIFIYPCVIIRVSLHKPLRLIIEYLNSILNSKTYLNIQVIECFLSYLNPKIVICHQSNPRKQQSIEYFNLSINCSVKKFAKSLFQKKFPEENENA